MMNRDDTITYSQSARDALEAMQLYAYEHFRFEEEYMQKIHYPNFVKHRRIHKDFDDLIYAYSRDLLEGKIVLNSEIIKIIRNWLVDHILNEDKKFAA